MKPTELPAPDTTGPRRPSPMTVDELNELLDMLAGRQRTRRARSCRSLRRRGGF